MILETVVAFDSEIVRNKKIGIIFVDVLYICHDLICAANVCISSNILYVTLEIRGVARTKVSADTERINLSNLYGLVKSYRTLELSVYIAVRFACFCVANDCNMRPCVKIISEHVNVGKGLIGRAVWTNIIKANRAGCRNLGAYALG